jgi:uncharacterized membrane protein
MKTLLSTTALLLTLGFSTVALANMNTEWYGKEGQDHSPAYMENAISKLPKDDADQFRETMKDARENNKPLWDQVDNLHGDLHAILIAPTFDKGAFLAKRQQVQQLHDQMETNMTVAFATAVDGLSQEERVTLTRALHHEHDKRHHSMHKKVSDNYPSQPKAPIADTAPTNGGTK